MLDETTVDEIMRRPAVEDATGLGRSTIYDLMSKGLFPRPVKLTGKAVGWRKGEIRGWLKARPKVAA